MFRFQCQICGHRFATTSAAEAAVCGDDGCPGCGGTDVEIADETRDLERFEAHEAQGRGLAALYDEHGIRIPTEGDV